LALNRFHRPIRPLFDSEPGNVKYKRREHEERTRTFVPLSRPAIRSPGPYASAQVDEKSQHADRCQSFETAYLGSVGHGTLSTPRRRFNLGCSAVCRRELSKVQAVVRQLRTPFVSSTTPCAQRCPILSTHPAFEFVPNSSLVSPAQRKLSEPTTPKSMNLNRFPGRSWDLRRIAGLSGHPTNIKDASSGNVCCGRPCSIAEPSRASRNQVWGNPTGSNPPLPIFARDRPRVLAGPSRGENRTPVALAKGVAKFRRPELNLTKNHIPKHHSQTGARSKKDHSPAHSPSACRLQAPRNRADDMSLNDIGAALIRSGVIFFERR